MNPRTKIVETLSRVFRISYYIQEENAFILFASSRKEAEPSFLYSREEVFKGLEGIPLTDLIFEDKEILVGAFYTQAKCIEDPKEARAVYEELGIRISDRKGNEIPLYTREEVSSMLDSSQVGEYSSEDYLRALLVSPLDVRGVLREQLQAALSIVDSDELSTSILLALNSGKP